MPYVAVAVVLPVKLNTAALVVPPMMVTFSSVTLPTLETVLPRVKVVLPNTTLEFCIAVTYRNSDIACACQSALLVYGKGSYVCGIHHTYL
jgi:hypothetical protein